MLLLLLLLLLPLPPSRRRCLPNAESSPAMLTPQPLPALRCAHTGEGGSHWYSEQWCNCGRSACPADIGCDRDQRWQSVGSDGKGCGKLLCSCDTISAALRKPAPALWTGSGCTWACPAGYAGASEVQPVASACTACPAGTFGKSGKCTACPVGQHTAESTDAAAATVHQICIGGGARTEFPSSTTFGFTAACRKAGSNHRSCDDHSFGANAQACYTACRKLGKTGCCTFRAHLVSTAGGGNGCFFIEGGTRSGNGNSDIWSGLMTAPAYGALQVPGAPACIDIASGCAAGRFKPITVGGFTFYVIDSGTCASHGYTEISSRAQCTEANTALGSTGLTAPGKNYLTSASSAACYVHRSTFVVGGNMPSYVAWTGTAAYWTGAVKNSYHPICKTSAVEKSLCDKCALGKYSGTGAFLCSDCPAGYDCAAAAIRRCDPGKYSLLGATSCKECAAGKFGDQYFHCRQGANGQCHSASISCFGSCASMANWKAPTYTGDYAGFQAFCSSWAANGGVFNGGLGECPTEPLLLTNPMPSQVSAACSASCPVGKYSGAGASSCKDCPAGHFGSQVALTSATCSGDCRPGTFALAAASSCTVCAGGMFQESRGKSSCLDCAPGRHLTASSFMPTCHACPTGKYQPLAGQEVCLRCTRGKISMLTATTTLTDSNGYLLGRACGMPPQTTGNHGVCSSSSTIEKVMLCENTATCANQGITSLETCVAAVEANPLCAKTVLSWGYGYKSHCVCATPYWGGIKSTGRDMTAKTGRWPQEIYLMSSAPTQCTFPSCSQGEYGDATGWWWNQPLNCQKCPLGQVTDRTFGGTFVYPQQRASSCR
jgi:hypothetical protein